MSLIYHLVLLKAKPDAPADKIKQAIDAIFALKTKCVRADAKTPYIKDIKGGKDISIEGNANGNTHAFIVEFNSIADRDYYIKEDKAHQAELASLVHIIEGAMTVDFENKVV